MTPYHNDSMNFALQNDQGKQLGFLLMVADETQAHTGECLIRLLAEDEVLAQSPAGQLLNSLQSSQPIVWCFDGQKTLLVDQEGQFIGSIKEQTLTIQAMRFLLVDLAGNI